MKKIILFVLVIFLFVSCDYNKGINIPTSNSINENFKRIDTERDAREMISSDLRFIMDYIYKYCDNID